MTTTYIVDAHLRYQYGLRVDRLAAEGFSALIVKVTEGMTRYTASSRFETWRSQAESTGLLFGSYHWLRGDCGGRAQVDRYLAHAGTEPGRIYAIDVEDPKSPPSKSVVLAAIERYVERMPGHPLVIYSGKWWVDQYAPWLRSFDLSSLGPVRLWDSHYVHGPGYASALYESVPASWWERRYGGLAPTLLQFTGSARIGGISPVDASAFRGTPDEMRAVLTSTSPPISTMEESAMFFAWNLSTPDPRPIIATDGATWSLSVFEQTFPAYTYDEIMTMKNQGIPLVNVTSDRMAAYSRLPDPSEIRQPSAGEPLDYAELARALLAEMANR